MICVQAYPDWTVELVAKAYNVSSSLVEEIMYAEAGQTEACLALDVYVPANIFNRNSSSPGSSSSAIYVTLTYLADRQQSPCPALDSWWRFHIRLEELIWRSSWHHRPVHVE